MNLKPLLTLLLTFATAVLTAGAERVEPLLGAWVRHQEAPFNIYCPYYLDSQGNASAQRCVVGCVATALESIVSYHRREVVLHEMLPAWNGKHFTTDDIPAGTRIDTRLILADYGDGTAASVGMTDEAYSRSIDAVARLSLVCGMMAQMNWGLEASGADAGNLVAPLRSLFGWQTVEYIDSYNYSPAQWREVLKNELRNGRPVLLTGYTVNISGHAFVVDGFDDDDRFHINWGYAGPYDDGYYDITQLCAWARPSDTAEADIPQGFFCNQQALILHPDIIDTTLLADSIKRSGREIVVESMEVEGEILADKFTPITISLYNSSDKALCTPFEIFTNKSTDKDIFKDGDYGALFGANLAAGERRTMTIPCKFSKTGNRILRLSPDDKTIIAHQNVNVGIGVADRLRFGTVAASFEAEGKGNDATVSATFDFDVANDLGQRSGDLVTYCLLEGEAPVKDGDWRHYSYYYLDPWEERHDSVTFRHLVPGTEHLFYIRWPWTVRQQYRFTVPDAEAVGEHLILHPERVSDCWYDLSGRRATDNAHGLRVHSGKKIIR